MADTKQSELIRTVLEGIKDVVDSNTVLGKPIEAAGGTTIIPVTKVSVGITAGGLDWFGKHRPAEKSDPAKLTSFGGGGGSGISVSPVGFLVIKQSGSVSLLTVDAAANRSTAESIVDTVLDTIDRSPEIVDRIKAAIKKIKPEKDEDKAEKEEETVIELSEDAE